MFTVYINNKKIILQKPMTVLQACEQANVDVPKFCYHDKLSVAGSCRMCLVEIEKMPKPVASCAMPVSNNMTIFTNTPLVKKAREAVLEFLLINHPLDCPICDQGGECDLQDQSYHYGSDRSRFFKYKRGVEDKECGPIIKTIMTRCIHCTRCVRFSSEIAGLPVLGAFGRGEHTEIGTYINKFIKTELSGNLVDICPVGALTSKPYAFSARSWELKRNESVDFFDAVGSNINIYTRGNMNTSKYFYNKTASSKDEIMRILPKLNDDINENWISDKTRYAFDGLRIQRLESIYVNKIGQNKRLDWKNSLKLFSDLIISKRFNQNTKFLIGELQGLNSIFFIKKFVEWLGFKNIQLGQQNSVLNINHYSNYRFNSLIKNIEKSDTILLIGCNPRFEGSSINTHIRQAVSRNNTQVFSIGSFFTPNYELKHIGSSHKTLVEVAEGKHLICKELRQAKNLLMIVGTDIFKTKSPFVFQKLVNDLGRHLYLHNYEWNGFNVLTPSLTEINAWECGLSFGSNSESNNSYAEKIEYENIFSINYHNSIENQKDINNKFIINFNSHLSSNDWLASYNFPITSTYEKNEFLTNTEGRIQKAFKSTTEPTHSRNLENIIQALIKINDEKNVNHFTKEKFFEENPRLKRWQEGVPSGFTKFLHQDFKGGRLYLSYFRNVVDNFYMTDFLSQNSKIMAQAYKFMNNRSNFFDIK